MKESLRIKSVNEVSQISLAVLFRVFYKYGKELLLLLVMFFFIYPTNFNFLPFPTDRLFQVLGFIYVGVTFLLSKEKGMPYSVVVYCSLILFLTFYAMFPLLWSDDKDLYLVKKILDGVLAYFSCYFVIRFFFNVKKTESLGLFLDYLLYAVFLQAVVSVYLFFNPELYLTFLSLTRAADNEMFMSRVGLIDIRLMGISNSLFTASINYGVHFLILMILPYTDSRIMKHKWLYFLFLLIIASAGIFSGRTVFAGIAVGLCMFFYLNVSDVRKILKIGFQMLLGVIILTIILTPVFSKYIDPAQFEQTIDWAFEMFYNLSDSGSLSSSSSDIMLNMYVWPDNILTWIFGDGRILMADGTYYMGTDIGYIRLLFYFGIIGVLLFFGVQYLLLKVTSQFYSYEMRVFLAFLFLWSLVLNFKGLANLNFYFTLFFVLGLYLNERKTINSKSNE